MKQVLLRPIAVLFAGLLVFGAVTVSAYAQDSVLERIENEKTLRVGWAVWHPYVFRNPDTNKLEGISYELIQDLGEFMGVRVEWVEDSWATLPAGIQANKFDITNLMAITEPRARAVDFSDPVTQHGLSLIAPEDAVSKKRSWQEWDRPDTKIAVTLGANSDMFVTKRFKKAQIVRLKTVPENVLALVSGRVQAHASTIDALKAIQAEHNDLAIVPGSFGHSQVAFALPKGTPALAKEINKFVASVTRSGRIKELLAKYGLDDSFAVQH